jgi:hypothetical protein
MSQAHSRLLTAFASMMAIAHSADGQMMRPPPGSHVESTPRETLVTEEQWINSIVDHWTSAQRRSWQSLNPRFRGWVSHLLWERKSVGRPSADPDLQGAAFRVQSSCPVDTFIAPAHSVAGSMKHFREVMPDIDWNVWNNIEPKFRDAAEWEMSAEHARAQISKAEKEWWDLNSERIRSCLSAAALQRNPRDEQIERRAIVETERVDRAFAPEPIKQEAREQISDAAAVAKHIADTER